MLFLYKILYMYVSQYIGYVLIFKYLRYQQAKTLRIILLYVISNKKI